MNQPNTKQDKAHAWVLPYSPDHQVAVPFALGQELIETPTLLPIPGTVSECAGLLRWRNKWVPVINLSTLLLNTPPDHHAPPYVLVLAYLRPSGEVAYGGIALTDTPSSVFVDGDDQYPLPGYTDHLGDLVLSCFESNEMATPIIDVHILFR